MNIDDLVKSVFVRRGTVCTFADCLGSTYAVGPDGGIYPCYRFVGMDEWRMGDVRDRPTQAELEATPAWQRLAAFRDYVDEHCKGCRHIRYCRGGCPYNALAPTGGEVAGVDPHCVAYRADLRRDRGPAERRDVRRGRHGGHAGRTGAERHARDHGPDAADGLAIDGQTYIAREPHRDP